MKDSGEHDNYNVDAVRDKRDGFIDLDELYCSKNETPKSKTRIYAAASIRGPEGDAACRKQWPKISKLVTPALII